MKLEAYLIRETDAAYGLAPTLEKLPSQRVVTVWVPKSVIDYIRKFPADDVDTPRKAHLEVPWWVMNDKKDEWAKFKPL